MRLIDEKALIEEVETGGWDTDIKELKMILKYVPTIDAVPVVHGKWITNSDYPDMLICSECGYMEDMWWADKGTNYCPNCGAKMDVES